MNYYERHLGDYSKDTAHLTMIEHGAYGMLLDRYYGTEAGIPSDQVYRIARARTKDEKATVDVVLNEFFQLVDGVWVNKRAEEEIAKAKVKISAAQENGKKGGRPKKPKAGFEIETQEEPSGFFVGSEIETQEKAHQTPDTRHQTPDYSVTTVTGGVAANSAALTKAELWLAGKSLLHASGLPLAQCGSFVGKLVKDYGDEVVVEAVRSAVVAQPADPVEFLKATCMHVVGKRTKKPPSRHTGFDSKNYREGISNDGSFS
jgi:uncharacterized protein YdaU (DUF1376 family)